VGLADVINDRLANKIDNKPTWINALTASTPAAVRLPIHFPTDRECLERIITTVGKHDPLDVTIGWVRNTLELTPIALSENLRPVIEKNSLVEIIEGPRDLPFDAQGNLAPQWQRVSETVAAD